MPLVSTPFPLTFCARPSPCGSQTYQYKFHSIPRNHDCSTLALALAIGRGASCPAPLREPKPSHGVPIASFSGWIVTIHCPLSTVRGADAEAGRISRTTEHKTVDGGRAAQLGAEEV